MATHPEKPAGTRILKAFATLERAEQFLSGELYMNTLAHFQWNGTDDQRDPLEGTSGFVLPDNLRMLSDKLAGAQAHKAAILPAGLLYANVCCFFMQNAFPEGRVTKMVSPGNPSKLGDFFVTIDDFGAFIDRIDRAARLHHLSYYCAPVSYWEIEPAPGRKKDAPSILLLNNRPIDAKDIFPDGIPEFPHDVFYKNKRYASQMEWRIALCRGIKDTTAYILRTGDLHDIAHLAMPSDLDADTHLCANLPHAWVANPEGGNIAREAFFEKLYSIEPRRFYTGISIG